MKIISNLLVYSPAVGAEDILKRRIVLTISLNWMIIYLLIQNDKKEHKKVDCGTKKSVLDRTTLGA